MPDDDAGDAFGGDRRRSQQGPHIDSCWPVAGSGKNRRRRIAKVEGVADQAATPWRLNIRKAKPPTKRSCRQKLQSESGWARAIRATVIAGASGDTHPGFAMT